MTRRDWAIPLAICGFLLAAADAPLGWALKQLAPMSAPGVDAMSKGRRILVFGLPSAAVFGACALVGQLRARRRGAADSASFRRPDAGA